MTAAYANLFSTIAPADFGRVAVLFGGKSAERAVSLKSGNAVILRGGSAAGETNGAIVSVLQAALTSQGLPAELVSSIDDYGRPGGVELMRARGLVDVVVPRGGASLIRTVVAESRVPVISVCSSFGSATR